MMKEKSDTVRPPYSRIFILHDKEVTKIELEEIFAKFGNIEDTWMVKDRQTGTSKGVTYVKFSKMSEAAAAVDKMNGFSLDGRSRPLKVIFANNRSEGSKREENEHEKLTRLFIVVPKDNSVTEETLKSYFSEFGEVDNVAIVRDRESGQPKGFAYVKFTKVIHTATALEECDKKYKPVLARPRDNDRRDEPAGYSRAIKDFRDFKKYSGDVTPQRNRKGGPSPSSRQYSGSLPYLEQEPQNLLASVSSVLNPQRVHNLFDLVPGLEYAITVNQGYSVQQVLVRYQTYDSTMHALNKFEGFEYPLGEYITIKPENSRRFENDYDGYNNSPSSILGKRPHETNDNVGGKLNQLKQALEEATSIIKAAGLNTGCVETYCSAKLPPPSPLTPDAPGTHRLFIVCQPEAPPIHALKEVFSRFGNLVECYLLPGRNYGYANYSARESAEHAMETLHGEELYGNKLKVLTADPPKDETKRPRFN